jgi:NADH:ubiquinone oxidoreductase subunit 6 (subunit J)
VDRLTELLQISLIIATVVLAALTVELKNLLHAVVCLFGMCIAIGILYGVLNAPYVMVFQLLIYAGAAISVLVIGHTAWARAV